MKITAVILLFSALTVSAATYGQKITLSAKQGSFEEVLKSIHQQSGYDFICTDELLGKTLPVNVELKDATLQDALNMILRGQPLTYEIDDNVIFFKIRPVSAPAKKALNNFPVEGHVLDETGRPLPGATVMVKNANLMDIHLTATNGEGYFRFTSLSDNDTLVVRFVGYKTAEVPVQRTMSIALTPEAANLQEVVVSTGYLRVAKDRLTGAASGLNEEQYQQHVAVTGNFLEGLEGKVPGLVYNPQTNQLSIRGVSTFNAVNQPLIVVDGFPTNIDLNTINPNDIVSVSVLKDAAAAAIYGVRASNGVIVIETRRGKSGKTVINVQATTAVQNKPDFGYLKYAPASEYAKLEAAQISTGGQQTLLYIDNLFLGTPLDPIQQVEVDQFLGNITGDQAKQKLATIGSYDNLKDYQRLFYRNRQTNNINVDASGGGAKSTYLLGFNYVGDKLNQQRSNNNQYIVNLANTFELNSRMKFDFKGTYTNAMSTSGSVPAYTSFLPYEHLTDAKGNALPVIGGLAPGTASNLINTISTDNNTSDMGLGLYDQQYYPYTELTANTLTSHISSMQLQGRLTTRLTDWLTFDVGGNYQNQSGIIDNLHTDQAYGTRLLLNLSASADPSTGQAVFNTIPQGGILERNLQTIEGYTVHGQFNISRSWDNDKHNFSAIAGVEQRQTITNGDLNTYFGYDGQTLTTKPYDLNALNQLSTAKASFPNVGFIVPTFPATSTAFFDITNNVSRFMSYYSQGTYIFDEKYIATGSVRLDQSNLFGTDPQYRNRALWSAGLAWRLHKEEFLKDVSWINELKLRASAGYTGNVPTNGNGRYLLLTAGVNTNIEGTPNYYTVTNPENNALRWELTKNYNLGLDYSLFNNRLNGSIDYYLKRSTDLYGTFSADPTLGFNSYLANTASIQNKGLELAINSTNIKTSGFNWNTSLSASFNQNDVTAIKATPYSNSTTYVTGTQYVVGEPMNALYSYHYGGLTNLGQPYVLTKTGTKVILDGTSTDVAQSDLIYDGTTTPKYVLGLNNQFSIGAFDFNFLFVYYGGSVMRVQPPIAGTASEPIPLAGASNYWQKPGDEATTLIPALQQGSSSSPGYYSPFATYGYLYANQFVRKADYIKLRNLGLTYNIKSKTLEKWGIIQPQVRFQAQNAFRYTFGGNDIDPEAIDPVTGVRTLPVEAFYSLSLYFKF